MLIAHARYVLINRLVMPVAAFILLVLIGRQSGVLLGEYALVTTFFFVMQTLPLLGLTPYVMRAVARNPEQVGRYYATIALLALPACVLIGGIAHLAVSHGPYSPAVKHAVTVVAYTIVPGILAFLAEIVLISLHRARIVAYTALAENGVRLLLSAWLVFHGDGVVMLMWVLLGTRSLALLAYAAELTWGVRCRLLQWPSLGILRDIRGVLPVFVVNTVLALVVSRMDYFILSLYQSATDLGYYAVAYRLFDIEMLGAAALMTAVFPRLAQAYSADRNDFVGTVRTVFPVLLAAFTVLAVLGCGFAESYVFLLFHHQYPHPVLLAQLFVLVVVLSGVDALMSGALLAADRQTDDLRALTLGSSVYAISLLLLVPHWFSVGAFTALVLAIATQLTARLWMFQRRLGPVVDLPRLGALSIAGALALGLTALANHAFGIGSGLATLLIAGVFYPMVLLSLGGFGLSQMFARFWAPATIRPLNSIGGVIDHIAEDTRARQAYWRLRTRPGEEHVYENFGLLCVILVRWSRWAYLNQHRLLVRLLRNLNMAVTKSDITVTADLGPGLVLVRPAVLMISGKVGSGVIFGPFTGLGLRGGHDVGGGRGVPVVGDKVYFRARAAILGGVRVEDGSVLAPNSLICSAKDLKQCLAR